MSNGSQSHTLVTQAVIDNDNNVNVSVEVDGFTSGQSVEISGYVVQHHGAFATFNEFQTIESNTGSPVTLTVTAKPVSDSTLFQKGHDVTVFLRVAKVWVTMLAEGQAQQSAMSVPNVAEPGTLWGIVKGAAGPERYSPETWGGKQ